MAKHPFEQSDSDFMDRPDATFASETELLRGANVLPKLSSQLRDRVLNAASSAYRQARRWAQARQAASFLSVCLIASFVLSPLAKVEWPHPAELAARVNQWRPNVAFTKTESQPTSLPQASLWTLSHDNVFLDLPAKSVSNPRTRQLTTIARAEPTAPSDKLLTAFQSSDGWEAVQAFEAVRSRSRNTLQRALAAN